MPDFATDDDKGVSRKRSRSAADKQANDMVVRRLMADQVGRRWVWLQLSSMHIFENISFFNTEDRVERTYFAAGERNVGLRLLADVMRLSPREYVLAMEENTKLEKENGGSSSASTGTNEYGTDADPTGDGSPRTDGA